MVLAPLIPEGDQDLASWQAGSEDWFVSAACREVRKFCGWHVAPSVDVVGLRCWFGGRGRIMLPSTFVSAVSAVVVDGVELVADSDYFWDEPKPWIKRNKWSDPRFPWANVSFTHGHDECPEDVKTVIFELVATAMELPASNAVRFQSTQYEMELVPNIGVDLSKEQKSRLGQYRIQKFG